MAIKIFPHCVPIAGATQIFLILKFSKQFGKDVETFLGKVVGSSN